MLKLISISEHLDFLFQQISLADEWNSEKKPVSAMIHKGTGRAPDLHLLSAEAPNEALAPKSRTKIVKKVKSKSRQSLHFRIFVCQIMCTISINKKKSTSVHAEKC